MSAEQSLVGAMGCASWCAHDRLGEHAALAPAGSVMREAGGVPVFGQATALGLNEVGVTDLVMTTLWRCGPRAAAYAVSAGAETHHVGADIAILHPGPTNRIIHYQAKLAWLDDSVFRLKSTVTKAQVEKLNRRTVDIQGDTYDVTGRVALYQADTAPFLRGRPACCGFGAPWGAWWWSGRGAEATAEPTIGRDYYKSALVRCRCSPSGIVAAPVPPRGQAVAVVPEATTWPWEFDIYEWFRGASPLDSGDSPTEQAPAVRRVRGNGRSISDPRPSG
jgi:hypothetical protein